MVVLLLAWLVASSFHVAPYLCHYCINAFSSPPSRQWQSIIIIYSVYIALYPHSALSALQ